MTKNRHRALFGSKGGRKLPMACFLAFAVLNACCGMEESKIAAEQAVHTFRSQLDSEKYHDIYAQADGEFRNAMTESEITAFLKAVHTKLGKALQADPAGFMVNTDMASGTRVRLSYKTRFEDGKGSEDFVWRVAGGRATLVQYNVSSLELVIK